jgi:hypothetical protein
MKGYETNFDSMEYPRKKKYLSSLNELLQRKITLVPEK